jgi:hypothetical protein
MTSAPTQPSLVGPDPGVAKAASHHRVGATLALVGPLLVLVGTWLHPSDADPSDAGAAFTEYAATARATWVAAHLTQLAGLAGVILALILLSRALSGERSTVWSRVTAACGAASLAIAASLQAVDGIALKAIVDLWSSATGEDRPALLAAALGVRQIEIGLDGLLALMSSTTIVGFALVLFTAPAGSRSLGLLAVTAAATAALNGVLLTLGGFSSAAMLTTTLSALLTILLMIAVAHRSWRLTRNTSRRPPVPS